MNLALRPAEPADIPQILDFIRQLAEYERMADQVVATEANLHDACFGERPVAEVTLACVDGTPVGFALCFETFSTFLARRGLYLEDLFVGDEWRGRGIGRTLLRHLARTAEQRGYGRLEWAVLDWNEPAIAFYRSIGARPTDGWTTYRLTGPALRKLAAETDGNL